MALVLLVSWLVGWMVGWLGVTLCISEQKQADISELDKEINPNPFPNEKYSLGGHITTIWSCSSPSQKSEMSSSVRKGS